MLYLRYKKIKKSKLLLYPLWLYSLWLSHLTLHSFSFLIWKRWWKIVTSFFKISIKWDKVQWALSTVLKHGNCQCMSTIGRLCLCFTGLGQSSWCQVGLCVFRTSGATSQLWTDQVIYIQGTRLFSVQCAYNKCCEDHWLSEFRLL